MGCAERGQARFIKWTHRSEVRELAPTLCWIFHWIGVVDRNIVRNQVGASNDKIHVLALLILPDEDGDTGLALKFENATGITGDNQDGWFAHFKDEDWLVLVVRSANKARAAVMHYMNRNVRPL